MPAGDAGRLGGPDAGEKRLLLKSSPFGRFAFVPLRIGLARVAPTMKTLSTQHRTILPPGRGGAMEQRLRGVLMGPNRRARFNSQVRDGLVYSAYDAGFFSVAAALITGAFITGYALHLGFRDVHIGLLGAIPMLAGLTGLLGAWVAELTGKRRAVALWTAGLGRVLWFPLLVLPFLGLRTEVLVWSVLVIYSCASLLQGVAGAPWLAWMGDLVPESIRGRFWGRRNEIVHIMSAVGLLFGGFTLDWFIDLDRELTGYVVLFGVALIFATLSWVCLYRQYDPGPPPMIAKAGIAKGIAGAFRTRMFKRFIVAGGVFHVGIGVVAAFVAPYMINDLGMSFSEISAWSIYGLFVGFVGSRVAGRAIDKYGTRTVMFWNLVLTALVPLLWIFSLDYGFPILLLNWTVAGFGWAGYAVASLNWAFAFAPKEGRGYALALPGIISGLSFFVASIAAGWIAELLPGFRFVLLGMVTVVPLHVLFLLSFFGRLIAIWYYMRLRDAGSQHARPIFTLQLNLNYIRWMTTTRLGRGFRVSPKEDAGGADPPHGR